MEQEMWKSVRGYEGLYEVSSLGRVRSLLNKNEKLMKPSLSTFGYLQISLCKSGKRKTFKVHRLVADAFIYKTDYKQNVIDHINHVITDNKVSNLRWTTRSQNQMNKRKQCNNTSGYIGISWYPKYNKWRVKLNVDGKEISGGYFENLEDAIQKRKELEEKYFGEYALKTF